MNTIGCQPLVSRKPAFSTDAYLLTPYLRLITSGGIWIGCNRAAIGSLHGQTKQSRSGATRLAENSVSAEDGFQHEGWVAAARTEAACALGENESLQALTQSREGA